MIRSPAMTRAGQAAAGARRRLVPRRLRQSMRTLAPWAVSALVAQMFFAQGVSAKPSGRPNIVLIMVDDLGWMDLACQGNKRIDTPHVDRLARQGMRFTGAYAAAPVCSPTRAAVMTGQWPARLGLTNHIPDRPQFARQDAPLVSARTLDHLPPEHVTIAERLQEAGYRTAFLGKWHLAGRGGRQGLGDEKFYPQRQGFDLNIGGCALGGPPTYFDPYGIHNLTNRRPGEYLTDRLTDEAIAFIRENRGRPFFLNLWNYTVHWPMEAKRQLLEKYAGRKGPGVRDTRYAAMIECLDIALGRLFAELDALKLAENTLVVFTSDNGGFSGVADNRPLREGKGYLYEGGIRVPLIVRWPGVVQPGGTCHAPVVSTDFYPTLLEAAGLKRDAAQPADGESLLPLLKQSGGLKRRAIYFHYPNYAWHGANRLGSAVREGDWKLIENFDDGSVELYNLARDLSEKNDLAEQMPDRANDLKRKLRAWRQETGARIPQRATSLP